MIAALVLFTLPGPISAEKMRAMSEEIAPMYRGKPGLLTKQFVSVDDGARIGGFYVWESREAAEAMYDHPKWRSQARQAFGGDPEITWFDCPVIVDNRHDETLVATTAP